MDDPTVKKLEDRMEKAVANLKSEFGKVRSNRASVNLVDSIQVDYYGTPTPLKQMASISTPEPRLITITPWDKSAAANIEKAIQKAELGVSPANDGNLIRINLPPLTEERRRDLVKIVKKMAEESRVALRHIRRDGNDEIKNKLKTKSITEDDEKRLLKNIQETTDKFVAQVDEIAHSKEKDIMEV